MKLIYIFLVLLVFTYQSHAQDQSARDFLQKSVEAYGSWDKLDTFEYEIKGEREAGAQAKTYNKKDKQEYYAKRTFNLTEKQLFEINKNYFPGGYVFNFAIIVNDTIALQYDVTGSRTGKIYQKAGKTTADSRLLAVNNHLAYFKVRELFNSKDSLTILSDDSKEYIVINKFNGENKSIAEYYFSPKDFLLRKVISGQEELMFSQYEKNNGRMENLSVIFNSKGKIIYKEEIKVLKTNFSFDPSLLELPKGYVKAEPKQVSNPKEIAKDNI